MNDKQNKKYKRNKKCHCGSGKKFKRCCMRHTALMYIVVTVTLNKKSILGNAVLFVYFVSFMGMMIYLLKRLDRMKRIKDVNKASVTSLDGLLSVSPLPTVPKIRRDAAGILVAG